jgi:hypothetical protein
MSWTEGPGSPLNRLTGAPRGKEGFLGQKSCTASVVNLSLLGVGFPESTCSCRARRWLP